MDKKVDVRAPLRISHVQWRTFTPSEIVKSSVSEVKYATLNDKKFERRGGVIDPMSGPGDRGDLCPVCREDIQGCMGHPLHTRTAIPVTNKIFRGDTVRHLRSICFYCATIRLRAEPVVLQRIVRNFDEKKRLQELSKASRSITLCGESRHQRQKLKREIKKLQKASVSLEKEVSVVTAATTNTAVPMETDDSDLNHKWSDEDEDDKDDNDNDDDEKVGDKANESVNRSEQDIASHTKKDDDNDDNDDDEAENDDDDDDNNDGGNDEGEEGGDDEENDGQHPLEEYENDDEVGGGGEEENEEEKGKDEEGDIEISPDEVMDENGMPKKKKNTKKVGGEDDEEEEEEEAEEEEEEDGEDEDNNEDKDRDSGEDDDEDEKKVGKKQRKKVPSVIVTPSPLPSLPKPQKRKVVSASSSSSSNVYHPSSLSLPLSMDRRGCCGRIQPRYNISDGRIKAEFIYPIADYGRKKFPRYNPHIVMDLLRSIPDDDVKILGSDPEKSHPGNNVTNQLLVAPKSIRLSAMKSEGAKSRHHDDLTINYRRIRTCNDRLERELREKKWDPYTRNLPNIDVEYYWQRENGEKIQCKCNRSEQDDFCNCLSHVYKQMEKEKKEEKNVTDNDVVLVVHGNTASPSILGQSIVGQGRGGGGGVNIQPFLGRRAKRVKTVSDLYHELQFAVDCIEQGDAGGDKGGGGGGGGGGSSMGGGNRNEKPVRGIFVRLKGKGGRMRNNICGRRQNYSARTVVDPDPTIDPNQIGVPRYMARILTYPEKVQTWNITRLTNLFRTGQIKFVDCGDGILKDVKYLNMATFTLQPGYIVERHLQDGDIILANRQPTLHRNNLLAFFVKIVEGRTLLLHTSVTDGYNADHDGDEMNLFPPMDDMARSEALYLLLSQYHTVTSQSGKPLNSHKLNTLTAPYYMTSKTTFFNKSTFASHLYRFGELKTDEERHVMLRHQRLNRLPTPAVMVKQKGGKEWKEHWTGKQLFSAMLPERFILIHGQGLKALCSHDDDEPLHIVNGNMLSGKVSGKNYGNVFNSVIHTMWNDYGPTITHRYLAGTYLVLNDYLQSKGYSISVGDMTSLVPELTSVIAKRGLNWADRIARDHYSPEVRFLVDTIKSQLQKSDPIIQTHLKEQKENTKMPIYNSAAAAFAKVDINVVPMMTDTDTDMKEAVIWTPPDQTPKFATPTELEEYLVQHLSKMRDIANQHVYESALYRTYGTTHHNGFVDSILSKSKGSDMNYGQVLSFVGLQALSGRRISVTLPHTNICGSPTTAQGMILHSFDEGQTLQEMHVQAECGRETLIDTGTKTGVTGYLQRKLVKGMENLQTTVNGSVTNAEGDIFMTTYGQDGTDPTYTQHLLCRLMDVTNRDALNQQYHLPSNCSTDTLLRTFSYIHFSTIDLAHQWEKECKNEQVQKEFADHIQNLSDARAYLLWCGAVSCKRRIESSVQSLIPYSRLWSIMETFNSSLFKTHQCQQQWEWTPYQLLCAINHTWKEIETRHFKHNAWHLKEPEKTMYHEQRNPHTRNFTWVEAMYRDWVHLFRIVREYPSCVSSPSKWQVLSSKFEEYQNRAYICAGTNVGMNAASSIGEPATQMTMKTFHFAGNTSALMISGIPKLQQMWNAKKVQLGVQMKFYLNEGINLEHCQYFCARLPWAGLDTYVLDDDVLTPHNQKHWDEIDQCWLTPLKQKVGFNTSSSSLHPYSLRVVLNKKRCQARYITPQEVAARIIYYFTCELDTPTGSTPRVHVWPSPRQASQWVIRIEFDPSYSYLSQLTTTTTFNPSPIELNTAWRRLLYQMRKNITIHGITGIEAASYKMVSIREWNPEKEEMQEHSRFLIETQGSNLRKIRRLPEVDWTYCTSSNMHEIDDCMGTIVLCNWINNSSRETMEDNGSVVNYRHIELLGRVMTRYGEITSLTRHKLNLVQKNVLKRAAFEESIDMFRQGATFALKDTISGITECTIMGSTSLCGTGLTFIEMNQNTSSSASSSVSSASSLHQKLTPAAAWEKCQLIPYRGTASFYHESLPCLTDELVGLETNSDLNSNNDSNCLQAVASLFTVWNVSETDTLQLF